MGALKPPSIAMMPAKYLRVCKFYLRVMRTLAAEYDVWHTSILGTPYWRIKDQKNYFL
jgi:hypothetical protein